MAEAEAARRDARQILEGDRYRSRDVPRPLRGVLRWIGDRVTDASEPLRDLLSTPAGVVATIVVVTVVSAVLAVGAVRRRNRTHVQREARSSQARRPDPGALERRADEAAAAGDHGAAVRLRFRAGILRLEDAGAISVRPDTTTQRLVSALPSPTLTELARTFDEVAYGDRPAGEDDVEAARAGWPEVVSRAVRTDRAEAGS